MLKYLIIFHLLIFLSINTVAQVAAPKSFDDELPIAPQVYDEYGGKAQVSFQKDPVKGKSFSILSKIRKAKANKAKAKKAKFKKKRFVKNKRKKYKRKKLSKKKRKKRKKNRKK